MMEVEDDKEATTTATTTTITTTTTTTTTQSPVTTSTDTAADVAIGPTRTDDATVAVMDVVVPTSTAADVPTTASAAADNNNNNDMIDNRSTPTSSTSSLTTKMKVQTQVQVQQVQVVDEYDSTLTSPCSSIHNEWLRLEKFKNGQANYDRNNAKQQILEFINRLLRQPRCVPLDHRNQRLCDCTCIKDLAPVPGPPATTTTTTTTAPVTNTKNNTTGKSKKKKSTTMKTKSKTTTSSSTSSSSSSLVPPSITEVEKEYLADYLLEFALLMKKEQQLRVMEWIKSAWERKALLVAWGHEKQNARSTQERRIFVLPTFAHSSSSSSSSSSTNNKPTTTVATTAGGSQHHQHHHRHMICTYAMARLIGYGREAWRRVERFVKQNEMPKHHLEGKRGNSAVVKYNEELLNTFFTKLITEITGGSNTSTGTGTGTNNNSTTMTMNQVTRTTAVDNNNDKKGGGKEETLTKNSSPPPPTIIELPSMYPTKSSLFARLCDECGWKFIIDASNAKVLDRIKLPNREHKDVPSFSAFNRYWKYAYSHLILPPKRSTTTATTTTTTNTSMTAAAATTTTKPTTSRRRKQSGTAATVAGQITTSEEDNEEEDSNNNRGGTSSSKRARVSSSRRSLPIHEGGGGGGGGEGYDHHNDRPIMSHLEQLTLLETKILGMAYNGLLIERLSRLELNYLGQVSTERSISRRLETLWSLV